MDVLLCVCAGHKYGLYKCLSCIKSVGALRFAWDGIQKPHICLKNKTPKTKQQRNPLDQTVMKNDAELLQSNCSLSNAISELNLFFFFFPFK